MGGKHNIAKVLVARIEAIPHTCYAEPFVGMGGVFLRRRTIPRCEVINDLSGDVINLFRILQRHLDPFLETLRFGVTSRLDFNRIKAVDPADLTDIERAARFYYLQRISYGGKIINRSFSRSALRPGRFNIVRQRRLLTALHRRLAGVTLENLPFQDFIPIYDRPTTLFYLDPPYFWNEKEYGAGLYEPADHSTLASLLRRLRGRFILSINDSPEARRLFSDFTIDTIDVTYKLRGTKRTTEIIISGGG